MTTNAILIHLTSKSTPSLFQFHENFKEILLIIFSPAVSLFNFFFFSRDTARVLLRVLTARSVKLLLLQLHELDLFQAQWLNNYASENPPTEGDKFIQGLLNAKGTTVTDHQNKTTHNIDPQNLAHRLLQIRDDMARKSTLDLPGFVERCNTQILRSHLERNTFVSGSNDASYKERRGYFRPPSNKK